MRATSGEQSFIRTVSYRERSSVSYIYFDSKERLMRAAVTCPFVTRPFGAQLCRATFACLNRLEQDKRDFNRSPVN